MPVLNRDRNRSVPAGVPSGAIPPRARVVPVGRLDRFAARARRMALVPLAALLSLAPPVEAQDVDIATGSVRVEIGGRVQAQAVHSSVEEAPVADFLVRRARFTLDLTMSEWLDGRIQPDFAGGELSLKDAWVRFSFAPSFRLTAGQLKRPFDLFQLSSSTLLPVIERDGRIPGVDVCPGVGGVCSLDRFVTRLEYADRDVGAMADGRLGERVRYALALTNGPGADARDDDDAKSVSGRVEVGVTERLVLAGNVSVHDYTPADFVEGPLADGGARHATAWGVDAEWGGFLDPGLHVMGGLVAGENWLADPLDPEDFVAAQALLAWRFPRGAGGRFEAWTPLLRVGWADPTGGDDDGGLLLTPGLMLHIQGRSAVGANLDVYAPETGDTEYSLKVQTFLHF